MGHALAHRSLGILLTLALGAGMGCLSGRNKAVDRRSPRPPSVLEFVDGDWTFQVDSTATMGRWDLLWDEDARVTYEPVADGPVWSMTLSDKGHRIRLAASGDSIVGTRSKVTERIAVFDLEAFAGGRFVVRTGDHGLRGELTMFGSGVPVTGSARGSLVPVVREAPRPTRD